jgi:hypothetical protein
LAAGRSSGSPDNPEHYGLQAKFPNEINNLSFAERLSTLTNIHPGTGTGHFFTTIRALG